MYSPSGSLLLDPDGQNTFFVLEILLSLAIIGSGCQTVPHFAADLNSFHGGWGAEHDLCFAGQFLLEKTWAIAAQPRACPEPGDLGRGGGRGPKGAAVTKPQNVTKTRQRCAGPL